MLCACFTYREQILIYLIEVVLRHWERLINAHLSNIALLEWIITEYLSWKLQESKSIYLSRCCGIVWTSFVQIVTNIKSDDSNYLLIRQTTIKIRDIFILAAFVQFEPF